MPKCTVHILLGASVSLDIDITSEVSPYGSDQVYHEVERLTKALGGELDWIEEKEED